MTEALLIFARYPEMGKVKTRLAEAKGEHLALTAYATMLHAALHLAQAQRAKGRTIAVWVTPAAALDPFQRYWAPTLPLRPQVEGDLGTKLEAAFEATFRDGASRAVVIGSDCPDLAERHIDEAFRALEHSPAVLGPALDGGYYLLGLSKRTPAAFRDIPWGTGKVLYETLERLKEAGIQPVLLAETLRDVDRPEDLERLQARETD